MKGKNHEQRKKYAQLNSLMGQIEAISNNVINSKFSSDVVSQANYQIKSTIEQIDKLKSQFKNDRHFYKLEKLAKKTQAMIEQHIYI